MHRVNPTTRRTVAACLSIAGLLLSLTVSAAPSARSVVKTKAGASLTSDNSAEFAEEMVTQGRDIFRFDTFGDEQFWGDTLHLHQAIQGARFGGVGPGVTPNAALDLGLKVDVDALPAETVQALAAGKVNPNDV